MSSVEPFSHKSPHRLVESTGESGREREVPLPLLALLVAGLFSPLGSYLLFLQRLYPPTASLLDLKPLELLVVLALFVLPFRILARLRSGWNRPPGDRDPNGL